MPTAMVPKVIEGPGQGIVRNLDPRHVPDQAFSNARNVRFPTGGARVRSTDGYQLVSTTRPPEPIQALWWYVSPISGIEPALIRFTLTGAFQGIGSALNPIASYPDATVLDDVVTLDQYTDTLIWSTGGKEVWAWPPQVVTINPPPDPLPPLPDPYTQMAVPLSTSSPGGNPIGKLIEIHKEHVLIGHLTVPNQPWRVAYSAVGDPFNWTGETAGDLDFLDDSDGLTALKTLGDHCIVHKPNRIARMIFVGPPDEYHVEGVPADDGAISARAPISIGSYQFFIGRTNIYRLASFSEPIGDRIWPEIQASIDWTKAHLIYAYRRLEYDEICWKIPTLGAAQPTLTVVYNFRDQTFSLTDHDPGLSFTEIPTAALGGAAPLRLQAPFALGQPVVPPPVRGMFGDAQGDIHVYGGMNAGTEPIHAFVESKHFTDGLGPMKVLAVPCTATGTGTLHVSLRAAMEARTPLPSWPPAQSLVLDPSQTRPWTDHRVYGRLVQVRLESNALDTEWEVSSFGIASIPGGYAR